MLAEKPVVIERVDGLGVVLIGTVHSLEGAAREAMRELERFSPDVVCVELYRPLQPTRSRELALARERYRDRLACIDRPGEVTEFRHFSATPPAIYAKEAVVRYVCLPVNALSSLAYSLAPGLYGKLAGGRFFTFGWSERDRAAFVYERDAFMAGTMAERMRSGELGGKVAALVGRRHVPGMRCILEAYRYTGDVGRYYAGGRVHDVFCLGELNAPYSGDYAKSRRNNAINRIIESILRPIFLLVYALVVFAVAAALLLAATAIALFLV